MEETEELRHDIKRGECGWFLLLILAASKFAVTTGPVGYVPFPDDHACFISFTLWEVQTLASSPLGFAPPWLQLDWKRPVVWSPCISKNLVTRTCGRHMQMACRRSAPAVRSTLLPRRGAYKTCARCASRHCPSSLFAPTAPGVPLSQRSSRLLPLVHPPSIRGFRWTP